MYLGFWHVPANKKHDMQHYYKHFPGTFNILKGCNIVFYYDDDKILEYVNSIKQTNNFLAIKINVTDLPTYAISEHYLNSCKNQDNKTLKKKNDLKGSENYKREKGLTHYNREYMLSGEDSFRKVFSIWTSKILLVQRIIKRNPFNTEFYAWTDVSISRCKRDPNYYVKSNYDKDRLYYFPSPLFYNAEKVEISAGFMLAHKNTWATIIRLYRLQLEASKNSNYAHDEETLLGLILRKRKELFCDITQFSQNVEPGQFYEIHIYGMKRSGHHLVVDIVKQIYGNYIYINNAKQDKIDINGHVGKNIILSLEDIHEIKNFHLYPKKKLINIIVMRDPLNNYASRLEFLKGTTINNKIEHLHKNWIANTNIDNFLKIFKEYIAEFQCTTNKLENKISINYNMLITKETQNLELQRLNKEDGKIIKYDFNKITSPHGSSFKTRDFLKRFTEYKNNKNMLYLIKNYDIYNICKNIFHLDYNT